MTIITDDFNRANATSLGANWRVLSGTMFYQVVSNQCTFYAGSSAYNGASWNANTFSGDQFAEVKIVTLASSEYTAGPVVRSDADGIGTGYNVCIRSDGAYRISRNTNGVFTSAAGQFANGDTVRISHASGSNSVKIWKNGALLDTYTDGTPLTGTYVGLWVYYIDQAAATKYVLDDFRAGDGDGSASAGVVPRMGLLGVG